jgi:hypothetical protein
MTFRSKIFSFAAILCVTFSSLALPAPALAAPPVITGVDPAIVSNGAATDITITGSDFAVDNVAVTLEPGGIPLSLKTWSTTSLVVTVPAGLTPGSYSIVVTNNPATTPEPQTFSPFTITAGATATPLPPPTSTPGPFGRPQLAMKSYRTNVGEITYGKDFNLVVRLHNAGQNRALNVQATFASADLTPLDNGGLRVVGTVEAGTSVDAGQKMRVNAPLYSKTSVIVDMTLSYYDEKGNSYSDKFTLNVPVVAVNYVYTSPTPTSVKRSQLVITAYSTDVQPLQPGMQFALKLTIQNMGNAAAKGVTMIIGGGSTSTATGGTPQPGGVSGGSGEFSNFAPVQSSNIQSLGEIPSGGIISAAQNLIVNVSTNPGAYPVKITFSYTDDKSNIVNDEQVITLLVYNLPTIELSFYQPVANLMAGQPNPLPIQLTNLGRKPAVLGSLKITTNNGTIQNDTTLVGAIDTGAFFTFDSTVIPDTPGTLELTATINYTDDFNQARTITKSLSLEVLEAVLEPTPDPNLPTQPGGGEGVLPGSEETFWQKAWRFALGLFGLDSGTPSTQPAQPMEKPIPLPSGGGPKG